MTNPQVFDTQKKLFPWKPLVSGPKKKLFTGDETKALCEEKQIEYKQGDEERMVRYVGTDEQRDRDSDIVKISGWDLNNYKQNSVFLWNHDSSIPAIGNSLKTVKERTAKQLIFDIRYAPTKFAEDILTLVKGDFIKAVSVGFLPKKGQWVDEEKDLEKYGQEKPFWLFEEQELLELSQVNIPANPRALRACLGGKSQVSIESASKIFRVGENEKVLTDAQTVLGIPANKGVDEIERLFIALQFEQAIKDPLNPSNIHAKGFLLSKGIYPGADKDEIEARAKDFGIKFNSPVSVELKYKITDSHKQEKQPDSVEWQGQKPLIEKSGFSNEHFQKDFQFLCTNLKSIIDGSDLDISEDQESIAKRFVASGLLKKTKSEFWGVDVYEPTEILKQYAEEIESKVGAKLSRKNYEKIKVASEKCVEVLEDAGMMDEEENSFYSVGQKLFKTESEVLEYASDFFGEKIDNFDTAQSKFNAWDVAVEKQTGSIFDFVNKSFAENENP